MHVLKSSQLVIRRHDVNLKECRYRKKTKNAKKRGLRKNTKTSYHILSEQSTVQQTSKVFHWHGFKQGHLANVKPFFYFFYRKYIKFAFENRGVHFYILSSSLNRGLEVT